VCLSISGAEGRIDHQRRQPPSRTTLAASLRLSAGEPPHRIDARLQRELPSHLFQGRAVQNPLWRLELGEYGASAGSSDDQGTEIVQRAIVTSSVPAKISTSCRMRSATGASVRGANTLRVSSTSFVPMVHSALW